MNSILIEIAKWNTVLYIFGVIMIGTMLSGRSGTYDGAGFYNSGKPSRPACVERDSRGNERWRSC